MKTTTTLTINSLTLDFSEESKNPLRPCTHCGTQTRGRESLSSEGRCRKPRSRPACMGCSMKAAMQKAFEGTHVFWSNDKEGA